MLVRYRNCITNGTKQGHSVCDGAGFVTRLCKVARGNRCSHFYLEPFAAVGSMQLKYPQTFQLHQ